MTQMNRPKKNRLGCIAFVCVLYSLLLAPSAQGSDQLIKKVPYVVKVRMTVDGKSMQAVRKGACLHYERHYGPNPAGITKNDYWIDQPPAVVAVVKPDHEGIVVLLPVLCTYPAFNKTKWTDQPDVNSPVIRLGKNYVPAVIWIRDVRHFDHFQLYPSIQAGPEAPLHVRVNRVEVGTYSNNAHIPAPTEDEISLENRFGSDSFNAVSDQKFYVAHVAYVLPKTFWGHDTYLRKYFSRIKTLKVIKASATDKVSESVIRHFMGITNLHGDRYGEPPLRGSYLPSDMDYYEIPMVKQNGVWRLAKECRGIRFYKEFKVAPYTAAHDAVSLSYKQVKAEMHQLLYDPSSKTLIFQQIFTLTR